MLSNQIIGLLSINFDGLFEDQNRCFELLAEKRDSGDEDTPKELTEGPIFDLSEDLFIWVTQQHIKNGTARRVAADIMSNVSSQADADLSGSYAKMVDMLAEAGSLRQAADIRRAHVAGHIAAFRDFLQSKKSVLRFEKMSEEQRASASSKSKPNRFQRAMAKEFPERKEIALRAIEVFDVWMHRYGISGLHNKQLALWKEEVLGRERPRLPPPNKSPMSEDLFWDLVHQDQSVGESETILRIEERLVAYSAKAIRDANKILRTKLVEAYREDIWALAYLVQDGCSDDAFEDFRCWIILQGRDVFSAVLEDPDRFDPSQLAGADIGAAGGIINGFENAYLKRAGKPIAAPTRKYPEIAVSEENFARLLPKVASQLTES